MSYVDGYILPLPTSNVDTYRELAKVACQTWMDHGALGYFEYMADDVPEGEQTSFPKAVDLKDDEVVIFAFVNYASREHRDEVMAKVMADERMKFMETGEVPFDGQRMIWGGFKSFISSE